jgi:hypothetical protein
MLANLIVTHAIDCPICKQAGITREEMAHQFKATSGEVGQALHLLNLQGVITSGRRGFWSHMKKIIGGKKRYYLRRDKP